MKPGSRRAHERQCVGCVHLALVLSGRVDAELSESVSCDSRGACRPATACDWRVRSGPRDRAVEGR